MTEYEMNDFDIIYGSISDEILDKDRENMQLGIFFVKREVRPGLQHNS